MSLSQPAIDIRQLTKRYPGKERPALDDLTLSLAAGQIHALLGANGAGKSALIRILTTVDRPSSGTAFVLGHDVVADGARVRGLIGWVGQQASVDDALPGRTNLIMFGRLHGLPPREATRRAEELLVQHDLIDVATRAVRTYSGGMRRRLDLAVGLVAKPTVLFVDEPTTGLDPQSRRALWADLRALATAGTTVLLTTQYLDEADELADHVAILKAGSLLVSGPADDIKRLAGEPRMELRQPSLEDVYLTLHQKESA